MSSMLGHDDVGLGVTDNTAEGFATFFTGKVEDVMAATTEIWPPTVVSMTASTLIISTINAGGGEVTDYCITCQVV